MRRPRKVVFGMHTVLPPLPYRVFPILEIKSILRLYNGNLMNEQAFLRKLDNKKKCRDQLFQ